MKKPVIVAAKRTAFGKFGGKLKHLEPEDLLEPLFDYYKKCYPTLLHQLDDVILGNTVGNGGNIARKSLLEAGLNESIPGLTIDRQCGSGLESVIYACRMIQSGAGNVYLAGGVESTSRAPWKIKKPQSLYEQHIPQFYERASFAPDGQDPSMIEAAENVATEYQISRKEQDDYAYQSHRRTYINYKKNLITQEIIPIQVKGNEFDCDESIKPNLTINKLSRFKPLLPNGTVTVGNCCMKNDGAALILIIEEECAKQYGFKEGLEFKGAKNKGVNPNLLGIGPIPSVEALLDQHYLKIDDIDAIELNEAFSSQVLACQKELKIPFNKLNKWGGAIASGHPYGASGAALVTRLFYMNDCYKTIATMGIGGGQGNAVLFERWIAN
ncbi:thiolase family protein [Staphylococcus warneri]|uniref:thiolase family protein n=1 Tax=Staphylococcus warneri TaxID=1292 RepID=UPI00325FECD5